MVCAILGSSARLVGGPAPLGYPMTKARKRSLGLSIAFMLLVNVALPCVLYYVLRYTDAGRTLKARDLYGFTSIPMGVLQLPQWPWRFYQLCRRNGEASPLLPRRAALLPPTPEQVRASADTEAAGASGGGGAGDLTHDSDPNPDPDLDPEAGPATAGCTSATALDSSFASSVASHPLPAQLGAGLGSRIKWVLSRADTFQWAFLLGLVIGAIPIILCSSSLGNSSSKAGGGGSFAALVLTYAIVMGFIGAVMLLVTALACCEVRQPCRMSSVRKGLAFRPALAYLWEDLTAVEGGGGYTFRQAFCRRFETSPLFREMQAVLSLFLSLAFLLYAALSVALTVTLSSSGRGRRYESWSFGANMLLFVLWNGMVGAVAVVWARRYLAEEERRWRRKELYHMDDYWDAAISRQAGTRDSQQRRQGSAGPGAATIVGAGDDELGESPLHALALSRVSSRAASADHGRSKPSQDLSSGCGTETETETETDTLTVRRARSSSRSVIRQKRAGPKANGKTASVRSGSVRSAGTAGPAARHEAAVAGDGGGGGGGVRFESGGKDGLQHEAKAPQEDDAQGEKSGDEQMLPQQQQHQPTVARTMSLRRKSPPPAPSIISSTP
ncbi:hypothetical protein OC835_004396 [Tilletia horrida]|nr:hypothetical protein OC835_004396 [Tilletia horrida]